MIKIDFEGARYWSNGCSPEQFFTGKNGTGTEAPQGAYDLVNEYWMRRTGRKRAGRRKKAEGTTRPEQLSAMLDQGLSLVDAARAMGIKLSSAERMVRRIKKQ